jgi:hemerythrin superfamily protein
MDALSLLKKDHQKVKKLFKEIDAANEGSATQSKLYQELRKELQVHDVIEEKIFYPALKAHPKAKSIVAEAHEEHHVMKVLLGEMDKLNVEDEAWQAKFKVLMENVLHHAEEEETEMFPKATKAFKEEELEDLGARMEALKMEEMERR